MEQIKWECMFCGCYFLVDSRWDFECPNCKQKEKLNTD